MLPRCFFFLKYDYYSFFLTGDFIMYTYNETYSERLYDLKLFDCIVNCFMMSR